MERSYKHLLKQFFSKTILYETSDLNTFVNKRDEVKHGENGIVVFLNNTFALSHNLKNPLTYSAVYDSSSSDIIIESIVPFCLLEQNMDRSKKLETMIGYELIISGKIPFPLKGEIRVTNPTLIYARDKNDEKKDLTTLIEINGISNRGNKRKKREIIYSFPKIEPAYNF